jgi:hypothetical protein
MKNTYFKTIFFAFSLFTTSCRTESGNERLAGASEKIGESASKAVKGLKAGIEKATKINLEVAELLKNKGISAGKVTLGSKNGGRHNMLSVYMIFDKKVNKNVTLKVINNQNDEIGRTKMLLSGTEGEAKYIDFIFDKHTNIDRDFKIVME